MDTSEDLFTFTGVGVRREDRWILHDVTATVPGDGVTALVGPSGAGKTTLLRLCNRLDVPDAGSVRFRGTPLDDLDVLAHRRTVGMVFQRPALFGGTVRDNLLAARRDATAEELRAILADVALPPSLLDAQAARLSGGEAQRACLARTLITRPAVLLLDEPTSALDVDARLAFEGMVLDLVAGRRPGGGDPVPAVWVTHDRDQLHRVADHVLALDGGELRYAGPLAALPAGSGDAA